MGHSRPFAARWSNRCGVCDEKVEVGEEVCYQDDEVCHIDCAEDI